jgi:DNA processing protein
MAESTRILSSYLQNVHKLQLRQLGYVPDVLEPALDSVYLLGETQLLDVPIIGIVGSRHASQQGMADSFWFAKELAMAGCVVISGLAVGIDAAAHRGAMAAGPQKTIAVIAHGFNFCYPARHQSLLLELLKSGGLIISEYDADVPPKPHQFLHRNRIIAALCDALLVIEAGPKSGALTTASIALDLGKDIYALPGSIHSELSHGGHRLIRQGAGLVESPHELLIELGRELPQQRPRVATQTQARVGNTDHSQQASFPEMNDPRYDLVNMALSYMPQTLLELLEKIPGEASENDLIAGLLMLELDRKAYRLADGRWVRFKDH